MPQLIVDIKSVTYVSVDAGVSNPVIKAAVAGVTHYVMSFILEPVVAAGNFQFLSDAVAITPVIGGATNSLYVVGFNPLGWCKTAAGGALKMDVTGVNTVMRGVVVVGSDA